MQKWQFNINRIIKVSSCLVVIIMMFLASVTIPTMATVTIQSINPNVFATGLPSVSSNGVVTCSYYFTSPRFVSIYNAGVIYFHGRRDYQEYLSIDCVGKDQLKWHEWPLGYRVTGSSPVTDGVLDISDFKKHSKMKLSFTSDVSFSYSHFSEAYGDSYLDIVADYLLYFFDKDGNPVSAVRSNSSYGQMLEELPDGQDCYHVDSLLYGDIVFTIPENAVYMAPCLQATIVLPGCEAGVQLREFSLNTDYFILETMYNNILEDSETFNRIEDQLGDLNDKADQLINGTDKQWEHALDVDDQISDTEDDLEQQLAKLDELENFDTSTIFGTINDFLEADGWKDIKMLLEPLLEWSHLATVMLFVFAFATMRFLLLGR